ncbi:(2Fe-2S)-binding protein [Paradesulfitobacterium ferrireducens]|uniref:(2Fe-2S)-binding protein n=1 Tax=Paradesulfitobacterium ferrireducens TaxID=2816476 RepID=UPI001A8E3337|nr:(2Fe-2S)-binding protein [Paradesulfitobacterium ferrireducens]
MERITLNVNGQSHQLNIKVNETLLDVLREQLGLFGTKKGCDSGACGACTVIIDGEPALSCMILAVRCQGREILTIEGLAPEGELHPLQESAIEHGAVQCGFCTPGWLMSAKALLDENPAPSRREVQAAIAGNLCRCTGYKQIEDAILAVAKK